MMSSWRILVNKVYIAALGVCLLLRQKWILLWLVFNWEYSSHCILSAKFTCSLYSLVQIKCVRGAECSITADQAVALWEPLAVSLNSAFTGRKCQQMLPTITNQNLITTQNVLLVGQFTQLFHFIAKNKKENHLSIFISSHSKYIVNKVSALQLYITE